MRLAPLLLTAVAAACASGPAALDLPVGVDTDVVVADQVLQAFNGDDNTRTVELDATLPDAAQWSKIVLEYTLDCPSGGCDPWDRWGNVEVLVGEGDDAVAVEIARVMTPYGVGGTWKNDVTELAPLLAGPTTFRSSIDTWVGGGQGWNVSLTLHYTGGTPDRVPLAVVPVLNQWVDYGDPAHPPEEQAPPVAVTPPEGATTMALRAMVSGHGQGSLDNCAEFCITKHTLTVGDAEDRWRVWRDDCGDNRVSNQAGNWRPSRAGWCPGDKVTPHTFEVPVTEGTAVDVGWSPEAYVNTCRGDGECTGCLGVCDYDGGGHTPPRWSVGTVAVFYP
ncbi:MAG: hypothetical protein H6733_11590 [Alphaproteobacteria bacterium]|nr:hypothetical protein [Alphaproteobacteria bacterium]